MAQSKKTKLTLTYSARLCSWLDWVPEHPQWVLKPSQISHQTLTLPWDNSLCKNYVIFENTPSKPEEVVDILESVSVSYLNHRTRPVVLSFRWRKAPSNHLQSIKPPVAEGWHPPTPASPSRESSCRGEAPQERKTFSVRLPLALHRFRVFSAFQTFPVKREQLSPCIIIMPTAAVGVQPPWCAIGMA